MTCPIAKVLAFTGLILPVSFVVSAMNYYVSPSGNDLASGGPDQPFKTIQHAAELAGPGDTCLISAGIYRETLKPTHSGSSAAPIVFQACSNDTVCLTGTDIVDGWKKYAGSIYQTSMNWSLGKNNQLFFDGIPLPEARWPNDQDGDPMTPDGADIQGGDVDHILCSELPTDWDSDDLKGAIIWAIPQSAWSSWTTPLTGIDSKTGKIYFKNFSGNWWKEAKHNPKSKEGAFYLTGALKLLDAPGEWFYDESSRMLYLWTPHDVDPNKHRVEMKSRQTGIDLSGRSWITVKNIDLTGCTVTMEDSSYCTVQGMTARYISHTHGGDTSFDLGEKSGIFVRGNHNRLVNCEIAYSAGNGINLGGADNAVINCWIHHMNYLGSYCAPVVLTGFRQLISHSTITDAGRDCIKIGGAEHLIQFNDIGRAGHICKDLGIIYSAGNDGGNTRICYNLIHDNPGEKNNVGVYLDNYTENYIADHNVIWNTGNSIRLNRPSGFCMVLNNTVFEDINNRWGPWNGPMDQWGCRVINNLCKENIQINPEVITSANLIESSPALCFDPVTRIAKTTCPGRHNGMIIPEVTPACDADIGAFQHDLQAWTAGHDFARLLNPAYTPPQMPLRNYIRNSAFEYPRYGETDSLAYWRRTHASTATVEEHKGFNSPTADKRNSIHGNSLLLTGNTDDGIEQTIEGLTPETTYYFSGYVRQTQNTTVTVGVRCSGKTITSNTDAARMSDAPSPWRFVCIQFRTGQRETSAVAYIVKNGTGQAYIDNTGIIPASSNNPTEQ